MDKELHALFIKSFDEIRLKLRLLKEHVEAELYFLPAWIEEEGEFIQDTFSGDDEKKLPINMKAVEVFSRFKQESYLLPQETFSHPGVIAVLPNTFSHIDAINTAKDNFREVILQNVKPKLKNNASKTIRDSLAKHGEGVVNLWQIYRHINYVNYTPDRIAWTKGTACSYKIITREQAMNELSSLRDEAAKDRDLQKLGALSLDVTLIKRHRIKAGWQVNISRINDEGYIETVNKANSIPLLYLHNDSMPYPLVEHAVKREREGIRSDKLVCEEPYLRSINVYIYR